MTVFSLAVLFIATAAWFTASRKVDADGNGFIASILNGIVESVEFHEMDSSEYVYKEEPTLAFEIDNSVDGGIKYTTGDASTPIQIGTYSTYESKKSLMVLFKLRQDGSDSDYSFTLKATTSITDFTKSLLGIDGKLVEENNSISNVIQFYTTTFPSQDDISYNFSTSKADIESSSSKFVTISDNSASLKSTLSLVENTSKVNSIAVILSYNTDAMEMIYTKYLGDPALSNAAIYFKDIDFTLVV